MVETGLSRFIREETSSRSLPSALVANQSSILPDFRYSWQALAEEGFNLVRIFSPEHGLFGVEQDQVPVREEAGLSLPVICLYGDDESSLRPRPKDLEGIGRVIFDIQDVGSRYYTYLQTLVFFLEALSGTGTEIVVLDRPNPLGGVALEGPGLDPDYRSFVGYLPVPPRHGLTAGEYALFARDHLGLDCELRVVTMEGWRRGMTFRETGLPWVPPSPNMPTPDTALVYPGGCLLEGTELSEGRGTTTPFQVAGSPDLDIDRLIRDMESWDLPGLRLRPLLFRPQFNKHAGRLCQGVGIHPADRTFRPFETFVVLVHSAFRQDALHFTRDVYEFNSVHPAFDLLTGSGAIRQLIESGARPAEIRESWRENEKSFMESRSPFLLYS
jgi:uncharacterized protein YbbC (DUF1343 family)